MQPLVRNKTIYLNQYIEQLLLLITVILISVSTESWKLPCIPEDLTAILASLSLNPNVETLVKTTIKESHNLTVKELRLLIKDKLRMLNTLSK